MPDDSAEQGESAPQHNRGWLRAAVLGANDGIVSTASLILGVAATHAEHRSLMIATASGIVAGAMSMATGEYVSVSSQADSEHAALAREQRQLARDCSGEQRELAAIYVQRGVERDLAMQVARQLMAHDALGAHARDEHGLFASNRALPLQAALTSAASFSSGAGLPLLIAVFVPADRLVAVMVPATLLTLGSLGAMAARIGDANVLRGMLRVMFWSALAMSASTAIGTLIGAHA